jgi:shikimate dehydrogenase
VIGNPVAHSQSPWIHTAFALQTDQRLHYDRLLAPLDGFAACLQAFADAGAQGCNITVPFKGEAFGWAQRHTDRARLAQAANTLRRDADGAWLADNTDGAGLVRDIAHNAARPLAGLRVLMIGAGGAAAGALGPLLQTAPAELVLLNRSPDKAQALVDRHAALAPTGTRLRAGGLADSGADGYDVVVNASASSLHGAALPVSPQVFQTGTLALDMMYGPAAEGFLATARAQGAVARDGLGMLVEQAAEAFFLWRGVRPLTAPVLAQLRQRMTAPPAPDGS